MIKKVVFISFLFLVAQLILSAQKPDSTLLQKDTITANVPVVTINYYNVAIQNLLSQSKFINSKGIPSTIIVTVKKQQSLDYSFYILLGLVSMLALLKFFFNRYFTTLFKVFFNTSLRQSQLTDQLLLAKLPSLLFNIFFVVSGGLFAFYILLHHKLMPTQNLWLSIIACILILAIIYLIKYIVLKFIGWITGQKEAANTFAFVIFLINKIIGIVLVPFLLLIVFSGNNVAKISAIVSLFIIAFLLLLRFVRSYGLVQNQLKISKLHFVLYITGIEIIPLLMLYKGLLVLLSKNL